MDNEKTPRRDYPRRGWLIATLTILPLIPMLVGYAIPSTRRYLGVRGVTIASIAMFVVFWTAVVLILGTENVEQVTDTPKPTNAPVPTMQRGIAHRYTITREVDSTFGSRTRATLNIYAPTATTDLDRYATVRKAAQDYIRASGIDVVFVRQFVIEAVPSAVALVVYSPDGCGWVGDECTGEVWREKP